jgi:hypothetical protein
VVQLRLMSIDTKKLKMDEVLTWNSLLPLKDKMRVARLLTLHKAESKVLILNAPRRTLLLKITV